MKFSKQQIQKISAILKSSWLVLLVIFLSSFFLSVPLPKKYLPALQKDPIQLVTEKKKFEYEKNNFTYFADPKFSYELWGVVVTRNKIGAWWDVPNAREKDLCVVWGENLEKNLDSISFWSGNYTCYWQNTAEDSINGLQLSNNHLVAENEFVRNKISRAKIGDQIYLKGYLVEYGDSKTGRVKRGTSITRTDTGNGACETIFVENFEILKSHWPWQKIFFLINKIFFFLLTILNVYWVFERRKFLERKKIVE